jgi:hypothetical protein
MRFFAEPVMRMLFFSGCLRTCRHVVEVSEIMVGLAGSTTDGYPPANQQIRKFSADWIRKQRMKFEG